MVRFGLIFPVTSRGRSRRCAFCNVKSFRARPADISPFPLCIQGAKSSWTTAARVHSIVCASAYYCSTFWSQNFSRHIDTRKRGIKYPQPRRHILFGSRSRSAVRACRPCHAMASKQVPLCNFLCEMDEAVDATLLGSGLPLRPVFCRRTSKIAVIY
jgi:hypothetical protein